MTPATFGDAYWVRSQAQTRYRRWRLDRRALFRAFNPRRTRRVRRRGGLSDRATMALAVFEAYEQVQQSSQALLDLAGQEGSRRVL